MNPRLMLPVLLLTSFCAQAQEADPAVGTNIIGTQEAPTVLNVVPWKDREVKLERKDPTSALLDRVLEPLDPDVLMREVEYHQLLNQRSQDDSLFLD